MSTNEKIKVALINPRKGWRPALGLLYIASYIRHAGYDVRVFEFFDANFDARKNSNVWRDFYAFDPIVVGFGVISWNRMVTKELISEIRKTGQDKFIICGGKDPSYAYEKYLDFGADVVTIGEGEETIVELLSAWSIDKKDSLKKVNGIVYRNDHELIKTEHREPIMLDNILYPALDLVDYKHYINIRLGGIPGHFIKTGFMMANRGCPFKCKFCLENVRNVYRERTINDIVNEIKWQKKTYKIDGIVFLDDLFYFEEKRVVDFCNQVLEAKLGLKYYAQTRVDRVGSIETLKLMKKAGFIQLTLGVESGSPKILKAVNKGITLNQIKEGVRKINDAGICSYSYLLIGLPEETEEDLQLTVDLLKELNTTFVAVNYYMPMPGTPYFSEEDNARLEEVSFSLTENQTFRSELSQKQLSYYRALFQSLAKKSANLNLFNYPAFYWFLFKTVFFRPDVLISGLYIQMKSHRYSSYFEAVRTAMINYRIYAN